jgi:hypothetical protein
MLKYGRHLRACDGGGSRHYKVGYDGQTGFVLDDGPLLD